MLNLRSIPAVRCPSHRRVLYIEIPNIHLLYFTLFFFFSLFTPNTSTSDLQILLFKSSSFKFQSFTFYNNNNLPIILHHSELPLQLHQLHSLASIRFYPILLLGIFIICRQSSPSISFTLPKDAISIYTPARCLQLKTAGIPPFPTLSFTSPTQPQT